MSTSLTAGQQRIVDAIRLNSGVDGTAGPSDIELLAAVRGFVETFDYWYIRVIREAVPKYRNVIIGRINPFIRQFHLSGLSPRHAAERLVGDYSYRNFVTAGGWALESMAASISSDAQKSTAEGIDLQRHRKTDNSWDLYVLKSGPVTRNSDIIKALKRNARSAEKLLKQDRATGEVRANYVIMAGKPSSTFEDGVRRPSSAEFWADMTGLPEEQALDVVLAAAAEAGLEASSDAAEHLEALTVLVERYIADPTDTSRIDWNFVITRNMRAKEIWNQEDARRHKAAMAFLKSTGYKI